MGWINEQSTAKKVSSEPKVVSNPFIDIKDNKSKRGFKVGLYGKSGSGKTHFAFTCPEPIFFIDTEMGATPLYQQFKNKDVKINEIWEKSSDEVMERDDVACFEKIKNAIEYLHQNPPENGTIVIDSATDLWSLCQSYCKVKIFKLGPQDRLKFQFDWGKITNIYKQLLTKLLTMPCNVVMTFRCGEEYEGPNPTGRYTLKGQKDTEYFLDIIVQTKKFLSKDKITSKDKMKFSSIVDKCRMNGNIMGREIENLSFSSLKKLLEEEK